MKVYQVVKSYYDGDHDHGYYRSPLFASRELAEAFLQALKDHPDQDNYWWWSETDGEKLDEPYIVELTVRESFEPSDLREAEEYLNITYT